MIGMTVGILAGGKSRRMGYDKARLPHGKKTFIDHLAAQTADFDEVLISVDAVDRWVDLPYYLVADELENFGPVEGIYQLLLYAKNPYVLVIAADMPNLTADFLTCFAAQVQKGELCVCAYADGRVQPLCCVYHRDVLPFLKKMRLEGEHRISTLFSVVQMRRVMPEMLGYDSDIVRNVNTIADYTAWMHCFMDKRKYES